MTKITIEIWDEDDSIKAESNLDNPEALNEPPTPALILGSYIGTHFERIAEEAFDWFKTLAKDNQ